MELTRQERLWMGRIGDDCARHNQHVHAWQVDLWARLLRTYPIRTVLEVGCGPGSNLGPIREAGVWVLGVDVSAASCRIARDRPSRPAVVQATGRALPVRDGAVDLAVSVGVLIHVPPETLAAHLRELLRVTRRYLLVEEMYEEEEHERGLYWEEGMWWTRPYRRLIEAMAPLSLLEEGPTSTDNRLTPWLWEKVA